MNKKGIWIVLWLCLLATSKVSAQGFLNKLKQKAQQIGEKVIDKTVDDMLKGTPSSAPKSTETPKAGPANTSDNKVPDTDYSTNAPAPSANLPGMIGTDTLINGVDTVYHFNTSTITPKAFVAYALTLKGTPYVYGSSDPAYGLDCSGFVTHVFNHFNISVPRRTFDFKNAEKKVAVKDARLGDIILFTGYDGSRRIAGHMGIVVANGKDLQFIHASSGQANGVTTAMLSYSYFKSRFLEVVRVF